MILKKLIQPYEEGLCNLKGKGKREYIGMMGVVVRHLKDQNLYDVKFADGQVWCCDACQLEILR